MRLIRSVRVGIGYYLPQEIVHVRGLAVGPGNSSHMTTSVKLSKSKHHWEEMAQLDPYWAILSDPTKKFGKWSIEEFYSTGEQEVSKLMELVRELGYPGALDSALDFGCGLGRLTRALSKYFNKCTGVDISEEMIRRARGFNVSNTQCQFVVNNDDSLLQFESGSFDLIYTSIVLQHVPTKVAIKQYVTDFVRILKPGGILVMQVPSTIPLRRRLQIRPRLYDLLRSLRFSESFLYRQLALTPIIMNCVSEKEMLLLLQRLGSTVLKVQRDSMAGPGIESRRYFVTSGLKEGRVPKSLHADRDDWD